MEQVKMCTSLTSVPIEQILLSEPVLECIHMGHYVEDEAQLDQRVAKCEQIAEAVAHSQSGQEED